MTAEAEEGRERARNLLFFLALLAVILVVAWLLFSYLSTGDEDVSDSGSLTVVFLPNVVGMSEVEATQVLEDAGFLVESLPVLNVYSNVGEVLVQSPEGGTEVAPGISVTIEVASGEQGATGAGGDAEDPSASPAPRVPDVTGKSRGTAESLLDNDGYVPRISEAYSSTVPEGKVLSQSPVGGTVAASGTEVRIVVSLGAAPAGSVSVPSVLGLSEAAAISRIQSVGLEAYAFPRPGPAGSIGKAWEQWPEGGVQVDEGSLVYITIGR